MRHEPGWKKLRERCVYRAAMEDVLDGTNPERVVRFARS